MHLIQSDQIRLYLHCAIQVQKKKKNATQSALQKLQNYWTGRRTDCAGVTVSSAKVCVAVTLLSDLAMEARGHLDWDRYSDTSGWSSTNSRRVQQDWTHRRWSHLTLAFVSLGFWWTSFLCFLFSVWWLLPPDWWRVPTLSGSWIAALGWQSKSVPEVGCGYLCIQYIYVQVSTKYLQTFTGN